MSGKSRRQVATSAYQHAPVQRLTGRPAPSVTNRTDGALMNTFPRSARCARQAITRLAGHTEIALIQGRLLEISCWNPLGCNLGAIPRFPVQEPCTSDVLNKGLYRGVSLG